MGSAGFPDGFIGLGVLAVLPIPLPVVVPGEMFGFVPVVGFPEPIVVPVEDVVPALPVPLEPAVPVACASATVLESASASAPANAKVVILMAISFG